MTRPPVTIALPDLDPVQRDVLTSTARFRVCPWGRRRGKSHVGVSAIIQTALSGGVGWWVWPSHMIGRTGWRALRRLGRQIERVIPGTEIREADREVIIPTAAGEGLAQMKSADRPDTLVGEMRGLDLAVLDEAGLIQERAWGESIRPALMDRDGRGIIMGTPKGLGWYKDAADRGLSDDPSDDEWQTWHQTSLDSPYISDEEKAQMRAEYEAGRIPARVWEQEVMAAFLSDAGAVFRRVAEAATATPLDKAEPGGIYVIGVDWGKIKDASVFTVVDVANRKLVAIDRMVRVDYAIQERRLTALAERFQPREIIPERNSMGEPIIERLVRAGLPVTPFTTTEATKREAIEALAFAFESGTIEILPDPVLVAELQGFEGEILQSGRTRYTAGRGIHGGHGDCVMSLAMAWSGVESGEMGCLMF